MTRPRRREHNDLRVLTPAQRSELKCAWRLLAGMPSVFASEGETLEAWRIHGAAIMAEWDTPFRRPRGWWLARGMAVPTATDQTAYLTETGELTATERKLLREPESLTP